jgi:hypothetical protein
MSRTNFNFGGWLAPSPSGVAFSSWVLSCFLSALRAAAVVPFRSLGYFSPSMIYESGVRK